MSLTQQIKPKSLVDQACEKLSDAIVMGEICPGERVREASLAKQLGISRGVLREAMQRLEGRKMVCRTSNIGVHVVGLSQQDLEELFAMREALEGMAARLSAIHMSEAEVDMLKALLTEHARGTDLRQGEGYFQHSADHDFHYHIARGSHNGRIIHALGEELYHQLRLYRYRSSVKRGRAKAAYAEHEDIVRAIADRKPDQAEAAMRAHLANARANLVWVNTTLQPDVILSESPAALRAPAKKAEAKVLLDN